MMAAKNRASGRCRSDCRYWVVVEGVWNLFALSSGAQDSRGTCWLRMNGKKWGELKKGFAYAYFQKYVLVHRGSQCCRVCTDNKMFTVLIN